MVVPSRERERRNVDYVISAIVPSITIRAQRKATRHMSMFSPSIHSSFFLIKK